MNKVKEFLYYIKKNAIGPIFYAEKRNIIIVRKDKIKKMDGILEMDHTQALLEFICKNSEMGRKTLAPLSSMTSAEKFRAQIDAILGKYAEIYSESEKVLRDNGFEEASGLSVPEKIMTEMSLRMSTMKDRSVPHIADMILKGASMGVKDISEKISEYSAADKKAVETAEKLLKLNSDTIDVMKGFLTVNEHA